LVKPCPHQQQHSRGQPFDSNTAPAANLSHGAAFQQPGGSLLTQTLPPQQLSVRGQPFSSQGAALVQTLPPQSISVIFRVSRHGAGFQTRTVVLYGTVQLYCVRGQLFSAECRFQNSDLTKFLHFEASAAPAAESDWPGLSVCDSYSTAPSPFPS
jgi:hypothetical protein